jgi:hypothetical protein
VRLTSNKLTHSPPSSHKSEQPLILRRQILQKHRSIKHKIPPSAKSRQANKQPKHDPVRRRPSNDRKDTADEQGIVEGVLAPDHIRAEAPEKRSDEHSGVDGDGEAVG